jgi:hypothetical protein
VGFEQRKQMDTNNNTKPESAEDNLFNRIVQDRIPVIMKKGIEGCFKERISQRYAPKMNWIAIETPNGFVFRESDKIVKCSRLGKKTVFHFADGSQMKSRRAFNQYKYLMETQGFFRLRTGFLINTLHIQQVVSGIPCRILLQGGEDTPCDPHHLERFLGLRG